MATFSALGLSPPPANHPPAITFSSVALSNFGGGRNYKRRLLHNHFLSGEVTERSKNATDGSSSCYAKSCRGYFLDHFWQPHEENLLQNDNLPLISRATHAKCAGRIAYFIPGNFEFVILAAQNCQPLKE
jgi:hypothetical protein